MRFLYILFITHVHLFVNNNLCIVKIQIICYDFNNKLATLGIQYNVCTAAAVCVHVCVDELGYILSIYCNANLGTSIMIKFIHKLVYGSICNLW